MRLRHRVIAFAMCAWLVGCHSTPSVRHEPTDSELDQESQRVIELRGHSGIPTAVPQRV